MAGTSSGRIVKTRKVKKGTAHQKNHRWESFITKISKLNSLDPIRRVRRHDIDTEDLSSTTSYFKTGLEKWQELNLSEGFISFTQEVLPLCDSLPQILHFEGKIMELLVAYMEKRERESLEPLLELLTDFAHDLGTRFEKYYAKALEMVTAIAGTPQDVAVIEWSFTCLAFLFKYLSKLLVPDLRPTYDLMAPLLGKHRQRPHVARFAAEAMSFLVKKAGAPAHREKALPLIVQHAKIDLRSIYGTKESSLYFHGLMTLFAEAMKGNGLSIHTSGPAILQSLISALEADDLSSKEPSSWMNVIGGVLTSMIHHTSSDTIKDIMDVVLESANTSVDSFVESKDEYTLRRLLLSARTIGIMAGVRKGTRSGRNWPSLLKAMSNVLKTISKSSVIVDKYDPGLDMLNSLILSVSITIQYAPMDSMIPFISPFMDSMTKDPLAKWFLTFCSYLSESEPERFKSIVLPYFQRFVVAHWSEDNGDTLCVLLPKMVSSGVLPSNYGKDGFVLPQSWQDQIVSKFERLEVSPFPEQASPAVHDRSPATWHDRCLPKYNALLEVMECTSVHPSTNARIAEIILRKLKLALRPSSSLAPEEANFIVGRGFSAFSRMVKGAGDADKALKPLLRAAAPRYARLPNFLEALLEYEKSLKFSPKPKPNPAPEDSDADIEADLLVTSLISNLSTASHDLRLLSLRLLDHIYTADHGSTSEALSTMIMVEQTPLNLTTSRSASMHIRRLATLHPHESTAPWIKLAIPSFCFGMLTVKYAQIWEDASASLKQIAESKDGEEAVAKLAFDWLETPSMVWNGGARNVEQSQNNGLTDFECSNLIKLDQLAKEAESKVENCRDMMLQKFAKAQELVPAHPPTARTQSLRVLAIVPAIAQRRSRQLVPMFLSWSSKQEDMEETDENDEPVLSDWTRKDQKAQLDLFGLFTNPKSYYKSEEVYNSFLQLVANGDLEIQKSALKAIFTWKDKSIKPYEENLLNLLDEMRFKDEIAILLRGQTLVQAEDRETLMPVLLRLLYGRAISRKGAASGRQGMEARRLTVLRNLGIEDIGGYLDIALGSLKDVKLIQDGVVQESTLGKAVLSVRKQVGFTHMIEGVLKELGTKVAPFAQKLIDAILYCIIYASRQLQDDDKDGEEAIQITQTSLHKVVRHIGLKCLILLFTNATDFDWSPYISVVEKEIISPRLANLPIETAQGISGVLRLFLTWSSSPNLVLFLGCNVNILPKVAECLAPQKSKDEVKLFALNIIKNVVKLCREEEAENDKAAVVKDQILTPNIDKILIQIGWILRAHNDMSKILLESCVETVSDLAPFVTNSTQAHNLVDVSIFLLDQPSRRVSPRTKGGLLLVLEHFVPLYDLQNNTGLKDKVYSTVTSLFGYFKDKASREVLSRVLMVYSQKDPVIRDVAEICVDLNSFAVGRLDEPDYDRRLNAFRVIDKSRDVSFTAHQWSPLLFNMLFYIRYDEEFGILSSNSADGICQFITAAGKAEGEFEQAAFKGMLSSILMPALFSGVREESEVIRREYLKVMAHLIRIFPTWSEVSDMRGLLAGDDELESSFFNNILTAGKGRQSSALGQLSAAAENGELTAKNVSHFFMPLIEHFIFDRAEGNDAHNLAAEATTTIGILAGSLEWPQYRALLRRFIGYVGTKPDLAKQIIRLVGKVTDALAHAAKGSEVSEDEMEIDLIPEKRSILAITMPKTLKLSDDITSNILPPLTEYLHDKDESTVSLRVPVAVIAVRLLQLLPEEQLNERLPAVLTDICHILRSKSQESRDMTRDTLVKICDLLGSSCFGFILKELRGALARGSQLHVLSYTMHSMLVATAPKYAPGELDYCLPSIVAIIMDDIFGATGQEKDAEEYASKMKEVRSSKSHDSMELIAQTATLSRLTDLVRPIQVLLKEKLNLRMVRKIDELLNRISSGLLKNSAAQSRDSLMFCWEVIQDVYNSDKPQQKAKTDYRLKKYLIQKGAKKSGDRGTTTIYTYKLVRFAFDVLRIVLKRNPDLRKWKAMAVFIPIIGDAVVQAEEEVKVSAFRLLTTIINELLKGNDDVEDDTDATGGVNLETSLLTEATPVIPGGIPQTLPEYRQAAKGLYRVASSEATKCISASPTTKSDIAQAALKFLSVVLSHRGEVPVKDNAVDDLLTRLRDDITEPERRHVTFNFIRAVLNSKVQTANVYDTLDYIGTVMVTNDDEDTRNLALGAYFQFLKDYPQEKNRWKKQLGFIVANLKYDREGGRLSILKAIHLLLSKSSDEFVQEVAASCFVPLIFVLANDDSEGCREAAGGLLREIFKRADEKKLGTFLTLLRSWIKQSGNPSVVRLALQTYGFYYSSFKEDASNYDDTDVATLLECILTTLKTAEDNDSDWEQIYAALRLTNVLVAKFPDILLAQGSKSIWTTIRNCLSFPHAWVKAEAAGLINGYFIDFARKYTKSETKFKLPLKGSGGLKLGSDDIMELIRRTAHMFKTPGLNEELSLKIVNNLTFLGKVAGENDLKSREKLKEDEEDEEDEEEVEEDEEGEKRTALQYLFGRLSFILRRETKPPTAAALVPKTYALKLLENLTSNLPKEALIVSLQAILLPLHNLTDRNIPTPYSTDDVFKSKYDELKTGCEALKESLKRKVDNNDEFSKAALKVSQGVKERRMQRSSKRKVEAVRAPERFGENKRKKVERKKERRKERGAEYAAKRRDV